MARAEDVRQSLRGTAGRVTAQTEPMIEAVDDDAAAATAPVSADGAIAAEQLSVVDGVSEDYAVVLESAIIEDDYGRPARPVAGSLLERREADGQLIARLRKDNFTGPSQLRFEAELAAYGFAVMMAWTRTGEIVKKVAEAGRPLGIADTGTGWSRDDRSELAAETVAKALAFFREILASGRWKAEGGATIKTYFIGACLLQFPNVYHRWAREQHAAPVGMVPLDDPGYLDWLERMPGDDEPSHSALTRLELAQVMADLASKDPDLFRIVELLREGYSAADAAKQVGLKARAVEGRLYRLRKQLRQRQDGGG